jgi:hypothetical protein
VAKAKKATTVKGILDTSGRAAKKKAPAKRAPVTINEAPGSVDEMIARDAAQEKPPAPTAEVIAIAQQARKIEQEIAALIEQTEAKTQEWNRLRQKVLPSMMDALQLRQFMLDDGTTVERSDEVFASISKDNALAAAAWLIKAGHGAIVKAKIVIEFEKGDTEIAALARKVLDKARIGYEETAGVHASTLKSFVKEQIEEGKTLPPSITHHIQPVAVLRVKKPRKAKDAAAPVKGAGDNRILRG